MPLTRRQSKRQTARDQGLQDHLNSEPPNDAISSASYVPDAGSIRTIASSVSPDVSENDSVNTTRKRKSPPDQTKGFAPQKTKKKGKLSLMVTTMPMEVITEVSDLSSLSAQSSEYFACQICTYLLPLDLLHLARSSKMFARFLLRPSASRVWAIARLQVPRLPDCPPDLSEQQYANFIFGTHCNVSKVQCSILDCVSKTRACTGLWTSNRALCR